MHRTQHRERRAASKPELGRRRGIARASRAIHLARAAVLTVVSGLPPTVHATRVGASATTGALQLLPDSTLQGLAAGSVGLGAGFYFAGLPRLVAAAAAAPAIILEAAIALRPSDQVAGAETSG